MQLKTSLLELAYMFVFNGNPSHCGQEANLATIQIMDSLFAKVSQSEQMRESS